MAFITCVLYSAVFFYPKPNSATALWAYKQHLLLNTPSPRLIIESGSNSFHAINSELLSKELGLKVINIAENFQFPLSHKIYRLLKYANKGDTVLLPLEYKYYIAPGMSAINYEWLGKRASFYFQPLPFWQKLVIIANSPTNAFIQHFRSTRDEITKSTSNALAKGKQGEVLPPEKITKLGDFDFSKAAEVGKESSGYDCYHYLFGIYAKNGDLKITDEFMADLKLLKKLQDKGVRVIFTYPATCGDDCFDAQAMKLIDSATRLIKDSGFEFIGYMKQSHFSRQMLLDTYYHIVPKARDERTKNLAIELKTML